ncbi:PD40 domain-containing protein [Brevibacillus sp. MS2.2]|uniref:PD40 domain-containing protein n=1 Tax=Brevibacillus sp. MS2.2 TaxID=2738981 RepID=UPI00156AD5C1|nr:PD40 domain-containing protein [Brevibacillus sp. MS2.2]NRR23528.1 PD40 domain-containing protein [Brevibacillus sp. MS2.2]
MQERRLPRHFMILFVTALLFLLTGCRYKADDITIIDPPTTEQAASLALERVDRLDGVYALGWLSETELLYRTDSETDDELHIRNLQNGSSKPIGIKAKDTAQLSHDRTHVLLADRIHAAVGDLTTGSTLPLQIGEADLSGMMADAKGSWADNGTYVMPIVKRYEYGVVFIDRGGRVTPYTLPTTNQPVQKVAKHGDRLYYLDANKQLKMTVWGSHEEKLLHSKVIDFSLSPDGTRLAFVWETAVDEISLSITDSLGSKPDQPIIKGRLLQQLSWSPDGQRLALSIFSLSQGMTGLYVMDATTGFMLRLSTHANLNSEIVWSPSGQRLFVSDGDRWTQDAQVSTMIYQLKPFNITE